MDRTDCVLSRSLHLAGNGRLRNGETRSRSLDRRTLGSPFCFPHTLDGVRDDPYGTKSSERWKPQRDSRANRDEGATRCRPWGGQLGAPGNDEYPSRSKWCWKCPGVGKTTLLEGEGGTRTINHVVQSRGQLFRKYYVYRKHTASSWDCSPSGT